MIVKAPHAVLRTVAQTVDLLELKTAKFKALVTTMKKALHAAQYGVAIAAPQIGESKRIFVVAGHVYAARAKEEYDPKKHLDHVFVNPEIISRSKKVSKKHEGCLSVESENGRMLWGDVPRAEKVTLKAFDHEGTALRIGTSGLLAQIFQHEVDHLNGILYVDHVDVLYEEKPSE